MVYGWMCWRLVGALCQTVRLSFFLPDVSTLVGKANMMELGWIQQCVREDAYLYSLHGDQERRNDSLTLNGGRTGHPGRAAVGAIQRHWTGCKLPSGGFYSRGETRACGLRDIGQPNGDHHRLHTHPAEI